MIDVDREAERVMDALKSWALQGHVTGLADDDVSPVELPLLMGIMVGEGTVSTKVARQWKLKRWVKEIRLWILGRQLFKAGKGPISPGSRPVKAIPNWLSPAEQAAWKAARERAGLRIKGIGDSVRARLRTILADAIALGGDRGATVALVTKKLQQEFPKVAKSWSLVAQMELATAFSDGVLVAAATVSLDALVAVIPSSDACERCTEIYLDDNGRPRVWKASKLLASGLAPPRLHPRCRCTIRPVSMKAGRVLHKSIA